MDYKAILQKYAAPGEILISPYDEHLLYEGRIDFDREDGPLWVFPATYVKVRFRGTSLRAVVTNFHCYWDNYAGYILDGRQEKVLLQETGETVISFGENLGGGEHELLFFKRQDSCHTMVLHGFLADAQLELSAPEALPDRCIEVYGDSVSAGEVSEAVDYCGQPDPEHNGEYSNSYYSYSWLTARKLGARLHDIAHGGLPLLPGTGWYQTTDGVLTGLWDIYDKVYYCTGKEEAKSWDFARYTPQAVIVAVGQNDSNPEDYMAEDYDGEKAEAWRASYADFLRKLREKYPDAHIVCATTILNHNANWDRAIGEACASLGDEKVHHFLYSKNGCGTHGHIRIPEAEKMSDELAAFLASEHIWE